MNQLSLHNDPSYDSLISEPERSLRRGRLLAVDDSPENLALLHAVLGGSYDLRVANDGTRALELAQSESPPELILLDVTMPGLDGYDVCRVLKADERTRDIPVIFVTAAASESSEYCGLECGAADYVSKPINPHLLAARVRNHLAAKRASDLLRRRGEWLEAAVDARTREVVATRDAAIFAMASLAESRDNETGNHIRRTQHYVRALATELARSPRHAAELPPQQIELLFKSAPLHDIGKVGIPDAILRKPGKLDAAEFDCMKMHPALGRQAIEKAEAELGAPIEFLRFAKEIAYGHHEKWDGSGYPQGLAGEAIPLSARLMAVADVYDALISKRVYKPAMSHAEAAEILHASTGRHFDPAIIAAFDAVEDEFRVIAARYGD